MELIVAAIVVIFILGVVIDVIAASPLGFAFALALGGSIFVKTSFDWRVVALAAAVGYGTGHIVQMWLMSKRAVVERVDRFGQIVDRIFAAIGLMMLAAGAATLIYILIRGR